jgi:hypothetical protein
MPRSTCRSKPRSRLVASKRGEDGNTCNCCLIPAPCRYLRGYRGYAGLPRVTLLFTGLSGCNCSSSRVKVPHLRGDSGVMDSKRADVKYESFRGHKLDREMLNLLQSY